MHDSKGVQFVFLNAEAKSYFLSGWAVILVILIAFPLQLIAAPLTLSNLYL